MGRAGVNPYDLHSALCAALERTRWRPTRPFRIHRHAIRFTSPTVELRDATGVVRRWVADVSDEHGHAFTRAQAKEIRDAVVQVMRADVTSMEADLLARLHTWRSY